jgi:hypothetical protein
MGTMSASDAAPLPRLGEVFFDVRGNSRSMRLSWYADTGVAVLSIWQGGMCTGTFRLAIGDLPRLVETLQRGPAGREAAGWEPEAPGPGMADPLLEPTAQTQSMGPLPGQGQPDLPAEPAEYLTGAREYPDHRAGPPEYRPEPPDRRGMPPEYRPERPEYRGERPEYRTEPQDDVRSGPAPYLAGSGDYLAGPPDQTGAREYPAPPPDRRAAAPEYQPGPQEYGPGPQSGPAEYAAGPQPGPAEYPPGPRPGPAEYPPGPQPGRPEYAAGSPEYQAMPPEYGTEPPEYRTEPQDDLRSGPAPYLAGPADHLAGPPDQTGAREYPAPPPDRLAAPPPDRLAAPPPDRLAAPPPDRRAAPPRDRRSVPPRDRRAALPPDGPAEPPEYQPGPPEYAAGPPDRQARPPEYRAGSAEYPPPAPRPRTEHLADLPPAADGEPAGYSSAIYVGSRRRDASDPGIRGDVAYPHDTGGQVSYQPEPASDLYQGTGPLDYPGEPSMPHYPPGTSAPSRGDALGRSPADYPAHYGTAVTDDIGHEPRQDSLRYGRPAASRRVPSRHGDPDAPHA